ncbi:nuclear pore protein (Nic96) [Cordyceps militaris CM01]|uniref:Nuclear pore protein (Nic96) n=1 Tax=Cordyceps militaris (strain CM01) TaxID=983644 RepID=G3J6G6_CORMM|nr:nuclear pore protein (Nic96) [Cordyceps militaris CM01]EGX96200.1 nuclear pore protein (Nic96) [Cordyceps militaris CM01]
MSLFGGGGATGGNSIFAQNNQNQQQGNATSAGSVFGQNTQAAAGNAGSVFGQNTQAASGNAGSVFGQNTQNTTGNAGSVFGQNTQAATGNAGSVFGQNTQNATGNAGSVFGQNTQTAAGTAGSVFGQAAQNQTPQAGSVFGQNTQNAAGTAGSVFGQAAQNQTPQAGTTGGLFGQNVFGQNAQNQTQQAGTTGGGFFGQPTQTAQLGGANVFASQQQPAASTFGGSLFANQPQSNTQSSGTASSLPAGAYFDTLFAKTQKTGQNTSNMEDLPSLELGLGDLRHRLRKLQSKPNEKPLEGKAHYLLAAAGVNPGATAKDLGFLDVQGRGERAATGGYAPNEIDVETYLSNLQTKTTLSMISDGLDRSVRDFDNFLEDNVALEWDAQRKRIYDHFGITPRETGTAGRESQAGFGRSRRSKNQSGTGKTARGSVLGNSNLHRSVIGAPSRIGMHESEFTDVDPSAEVKKKGGVEDRAMRERQLKLSDKVRNLNMYRLDNRPYPILHELCRIEEKSHEPHASHVVEAYRAMIEIVGEEPANAPLGYSATKERHFAGMYLDENVNSPQAVEMKKRILGGANTFLEKQFIRQVESLILKHPHEAKLGGLPDITSKIKAYIRLRSARKDLVPDNTELQQVQGEFVWAIVFYLLRSGNVSEAAKYVNDNSNHFRGIDRTFSTYLNNYAASEDRRITNRKLLERCTNEYVQRYRNAPDNSIDPFRMACYKVIGRIELANRDLNGFNTDINDWIWLQFNLAREGDKSVEMAGESYGLAELQISIREIGLKHFPKTVSDDNNSGSFGMFFYLQILAGMFEDAIGYLYSFSYVDAVHFGLALEYYGLLRPSDAMSSPNDLRSHSSKGLPQINFGRMIGYYTRDFRAADVASAVDYLTLICLNQDLGGEAGRRQSSLCHEALRELVLETREFSKLIGDIRPDGQRIQGIIEIRGPLIGLGDEDDFINTVTLQAASFADENGRTTDSVLLYHLAGEYDAVVAIVSRAISEAISLEIGEDPMRLMPIKPRAGDSDADAQQGTSLSLAAIDDPIELAKTMMRMYERDAMFFRKIQDHNKMACRVLLEMSTIKNLVETGQWAQCLDKIRGLEILPLDAGGDASTIRAYAAKFSAMPQPVSINVPNLLMWTVLCCVRQREQLTNGQFSGNEGTRKLMVDQLKQLTLDLTTYTSQLRYRFPPHLHEALARASAE